MLVCETGSCIYMYMYDNVVTAEPPIKETLPKEDTVLGPSPIATSLYWQNNWSNWIKYPLWGGFNVCIYVCICLEEA